MCGVCWRSPEGVAIEHCGHGGELKYSSDERLAWAPSVSRRRRESVVTGLHLEHSVSNTTTLMAMGMEGGWDQGWDGIMDGMEMGEEGERSVAGGT